MCIVYKDNSNKIKFVDGLTIQQQKNYEDENLLKPVFKNGKMLIQQDLRDIRDRLNKGNF